MTHQKTFIRRDGAKAPPRLDVWWLRFVCLAFLMVVGVHSVMALNRFEAKEYITWDATGASLSRPYWQLKYIDHEDVKSAKDNEMRNIKIYVLYKSGSKKIVASMDACHDNLKRYNTNLGAGTITGVSSDKKRIATFRFYPSSDLLADKNVVGLYFEGVWDIHRDGSGPEYSDPCRVEMRFNATNYDNNTSLQSGTFDRKAPGQIVFTPSKMTSKNNDFTPRYNFGKTDNVNDLYYGQVYADQQNVAYQLQNATSNRDDYVIYLYGDWARYFTVDKGKVADTAPSDVRIYQKLFTPRQKITVPGLPYVENLKASFDQWTKKATLTWENKGGKNYTVDKENDKLLVYRYKATESEKGASLVATLDYNATSCVTEVPEYDADYVYVVTFSKGGWKNQIVDDLKAAVTVNTARNMKIDLTVTGGAESITANWTYTAFNDKTLEFNLKYKSTVDTEWKTIVIPHTNPLSTSETYTLSNITNACAQYRFKVELKAIGTVFSSEEKNMSISGSNKVTGFTASRGVYSGVVKLTWTAKQIDGVATRYDISRRMLGEEGEWIDIYSTSGTYDLYTYDDINVAPGLYYEYKVTSYKNCSNTPVVTQEITTDGFCQATGTISGRVSYGTGTAVEGVKVNLVQTAGDSEAKSQFYSLRVDNVGGGVHLPTSVTERIVKDKQPFTIQSWMRLDSNVKAVGKEGYASPMVFDLMANFSVYFERIDSARYQVVVRLPGTPSGGSKTTEDHPTELTINADKYYFISLSCNGDSTYSYSQIDEDGNIETVSFNSHKVQPNPGNSILAIGTTLGQVGEHNYVGYIDEVRMWNRELSEKELLATYDHLLSGDEKGLFLYWPLDEGLKKQQTAYDYSRSGGVANGNHGLIQPSNSLSAVVPSSRAFSVYGRTDAEGNYVIKGVPFTGSGTNYSVVPSMGVHSFTPQKSSRYVSQSSLNHSGVDFEDTSSFQVSGAVYYEGTDYPVEGCNFYVDGSICYREGEPIESGPDGKYTISVPIGNHFIQVKKQGHEFANNGRYPEDPNSVGTTHTFDQPVSNLRFTDLTKVVVAGRVVGGEIEAAKPFGLKQSIATIGQAEIKLTAGSRSMNCYVDKDKGVFVNGSIERVFDNATDNIRCDVRAGKGDASDAITVMTDPATGEFAALLPPVEYKVASATIPAQNISFDTKTINTIDATNPLSEQTDSIENADGTVSRFAYNAALKLTYRVDPVLEVRQKNSGNAYGDEFFKYTTIDNQKGDTVTLYKENVDGTVDYLVGNPVFTQQRSYTFGLYGYEKYENRDDKSHVVVSEVPLRNSTVTITNQFAAGQTVCIEGSNDGKFMYPDSLAENQLQLDSLGRADYTFMAGLPNITEPYTLGLNIVYDVNGRQTAWDGNGKFKAIVLGELPTGTNFITQGPDKILMVLRDPPGSNSQSYYESAVTTTETTSYAGSFVTNNEATTLTKFGYHGATFVGVGAGIIIESSVKSELTVGAEVNLDVTDSKETTTSTTTSQRITTSDSEDFVGADGDVFIGTATNMTFGNVRSVDIRKTGDAWKVSQESAISTGLEYSTSFSYTQFMIENNIIPNLEKARNALFFYEEDNITSNPTDSVIYISYLHEGDEGFGTSNNDSTAWGNDAASDASYDGKSYKMLLPASKVVKKDSKGRQIVYQDKVRWYNQQIKLWQTALANNEKAKIEAKNNSSKYLVDNYSFDGGTSIENTVESSSMRMDQTTEEFEILAVAGLGTGGDISGTGVDFTIKTTTGTRQTFSQASATERTKALGYVLQEDGGDDALSVDVYDAPDGFGPIFITKGGQTSCPFEGAYESKYYNPGTEIQPATMQIEVPRLSVENNYATDVPSGGTAQFTLVMQNESETGTDLWFKLRVSQNTNPHGANLSIDGSSIGDERRFLVPAGGTLRKQLQLTQTDQSVLDYENIHLVLSSVCQDNPTSVVGIIGDSVAISAHFVPTCSDIRLSVPQRVINTSTGTDLRMTVDGYDRNFRSFRGFRIQYKGERDVDWSLAQEYVNDPAKAVDGKLAIEGASTDYVLNMGNAGLFPDQTYLVRAVTVCDFGTAQEINNESEEIEIVKDIAKPRLLGNPSPASGVLTADGEVAVTFNEDIKASQLTADNNFIVKGKLNGYKVDHEVAMRLNGGAGAETEADIDLSKRSFSFNLWVKPEAAGELLSHGTSSSRLSIAIDAAGYLTANVAGTTAQSASRLPMGEWSFLSMSYSYGECGCLLNGDFANGASDKRLFTDVKVPAYEGNGPLAVGSGMKGAIHELTMWNTDLTYAEAKDGMYTAKQASTPHLTGYWKMDEGMGTELADAARSRNMHTKTPSWYLATKNKALSLDGHSSYAAIDITECSPLTTDDYALELWFRAEQGQAADGATLFSTSDDGVRLDLNADGTLTLYSGTDKRPAGSGSYLDQQWHHMALNVLYNGTAALYVDGKTLLQFSPPQPLKMQSDQLTLGALRKADTYGAADYNYSRFFSGQLDEVRLWNARLTKDAILAQYTQRLDTAVAKPVAYYPFEKVTLDDFLQTTVYADLADHNPASRKSAALYGNAVIGDEAPGLKSAPREENVSFSFTASERKVVIQLNETPQTIEGTTLRFTLQNVRDLNNNKAEPVVWTAYVQQNQLRWAERELTLTKQVDEALTLDVEMLNNSSQTEAWSVGNLPVWLEADNLGGQLNPLSAGKLRLTVPASVALGRYEQTIYLMGNKGVSEPLTVKLSVTGEKPDWKADASGATFTMSLIGSLEMEGRLADDEADLVAAFAADGTCVGVASPKYVKRYDRHFVLMTIYGNGLTDKKAVSFRAWDASTGKIHPVVHTSEAVVMSGDAVYGSIEQPVRLIATDAVEQTWQLQQGWQWMSFYVNPIDKRVASVYAPVAPYAKQLKGHDAFAVPSTDGAGWTGALKEIDPLQMYMLNLDESAGMSVSGEQVNTALSPLTIGKGWNWIGYTPSYVASPAYALAAADPVAGDMVKSQHGFAIYQGYEWIGSFDAMQPGVGYMYLSRQDAARTFSYPTTAPAKAPMRMAKPDSESAFPAVDRSAYPNNMTVIARLQENGLPVSGAEIALFAGDECRGVSEEVDGLYFITVSGEGSGQLLTARVASGGTVSEFSDKLVYSDNAMVGTLSEPYVFDLSHTTAVGEVEAYGVGVMPRVVSTHVMVSSAQSALRSVVVSSASGHTVCRLLNPDPHTQRVDFLSMPQGIYFITVNTADGRQTTVKLTKVKQ